MNDKIHEKANPVFNTAKLTLFWLARAEDADAKNYIDYLDIDTEKLIQALPNYEKIKISSTVSQDHRFHTFNKVIIDTGYKNILDLACGYAPRAVIMKRAGLNYVGGDLPAVISEVRPTALHFCGNYSGIMRHAEVDVTNYESLNAAAELLDGEICIVTEGLFMYLNMNEKKTVCSNIRRILAEHGGCWLIQDNNAAEQYFAINGALYGENALKMILEAKKIYDSKSDTQLSANSYASEDDAISFFEEEGLNVERFSFYDESIPLKSLSEVSDEMAEKLKTALSGCHAWKVTVNSSNTKARDTQSSRKHEDKKDKIEISVKDSIMQIRLSDRVDSLNAPEFLEMFEEKDKSLYAAVNIDMNKLIYISSAGLRVLLLIAKSVGIENISVRNIKPQVREILETTGFDNILNIDK